jgi:hypothetical protein
MFLHSLLNVLVQIANKMELQKKYFETLAVAMIRRNKQHTTVEGTMVSICWAPELCTEAQYDFDFWLEQLISY